jgi:serine protease Do
LAGRRLFVIIEFSSPAPASPPTQKRFEGVKINNMNNFGTRNRLGALPYIFGGLLGVSLGLIVLSGVLFYKSSRGDERAVATQPLVQTQSTGQISESIDASRRNAIVAATEAVAPAVVSITARQVRTYRNRVPFSRRWMEYFGIPETYQKEIQSLGSGIIVHPDGYILTNEHVILNAEVIEVTLSDGQTLDARVVDTAHDFDIAILKVEKMNEEPFHYAALGDSDELVVGEWAIAIGQPFGQLLYDTQPSVTVGVISALHRDVKESTQSDQYFKDMIQTDAAINPGNSGGPLVNSRGEVIGINTFIFSAGDGGSIGLGFAIPINRGKWVLSEIQNHGRVRQAWLGIRVSTITPEFAAGLNLKQRRGLLVREIDHGSPAEQAGIRPGDVITGVNGVMVGTSRDANRIIYGSTIGERLTFDIARKDKTFTIDVVLKEKPNEEI